MGEGENGEMEMMVTRGSMSYGPFDFGPSQRALMKEEEEKSVEKLRWDLLPWEALREIAELMTMNIPTHGDVTPKWRTLSIQEHWAALQRHAVEWWLTRRHDHESQKSHMVHAAARALFIVALETPRSEHL